MTVQEIIEPSVVSMGPLLIRRVLPSSPRQMVGPFIFMDQSGPTRVLVSANSGVSEHPHAGLSTLTYLLEGSVIHRDSAGGVAKIGPGDVALMSAGSGVTHEELPDPSVIGTMQDVYFVQMWLALPDEMEDMDPKFEVHRHADLPEGSFDDAYVWLLMGSAWGLASPTTCYANTLLADLIVQPNGAIPIQAEAEECAVYLLEGRATLGGEEINSHQLVLFDSLSNPVLESSEGCRAILLGGATFPSARIVSGNFVASSKHQLSNRINAYQRGDFPSLDNPTTRSWSSTDKSRANGHAD